MKYAMLIYSRPGSHEELPDAEREAAMDEYTGLRADPRCVDGAGLQGPQTATTVRVQDGRTLTTDGPFADTKEFFGGYYVFDVEDLDQALDLASRIPAARLGGAIEIRPVMER
jgi:hypothetical protein